MSFVITRTSGKSDAEVIAEVVSDAKPGQLIPYEMLAERLSEGASRKYEKKDVQSSVQRSERKVAIELQRVLMNVRNQGYRIATAGEHHKVAGRKKDRANKLLKRGLRTLQHVDWDAMDDNTRRAHEGQLMVMSSIHNAMSGLDQRLKHVEDIISKRNDARQ